MGIKPITNDELQITVYPNPTSGELRIKNEELRIAGVDIFDVMGKMEKGEWRMEKGEWNMDISDLSNGVYFLKITTETGVTTKKIIKN